MSLGCQEEAWARAQGTRGDTGEWQAVASRDFLKRCQPLPFLLASPLFYLVRCKRSGSAASVGKGQGLAHLSGVFRFDPVSRRVAWSFLSSSLDGREGWRRESAIPKKKEIRKWWQLKERLGGPKKSQGGRTGDTGGG